MMSRSQRNRLAPLAALWAVALLPGCGNVTVGGVGQAEVYMSGDASEPAAASRPAPVGSEGEGSGVPAAAVTIVGGLEGEVHVTAGVSLRRADGSVEELAAPSTIDVTLDLQGVQEPRVLDRPVPAGGYEAVIVTFTDVTADVTGGLEIDGVPFVGTVDVDLGGPLEVTESLPFVVDDAQTVAFLVDLDAGTWIPLLDVLTSTVSAVDFAAAVTVTER